RPAGGLLASLIVLLLLFFSALWYLSPSSGGKHFRLDQVRLLVAQGRVVDATFRDEDSRLAGHYKAGAPTPPGTPPPSQAADLPIDGGTFWTSYPSNGAVTSSLVEALQSAGAHVTVDGQSM